MDEIKQNLKEFIMKTAQFGSCEIQIPFAVTSEKGWNYALHHQPVEVKRFRTCWTTSKEDLLCRGTPWWLVETDAENS